VRKTTTSPSYGLYDLHGGPPYRPGLVKDPANGRTVELEVWRIPEDKLGPFIKNIPSPPGLGKIKLNDGSEVIGFICEPYIIGISEDITDYGGWRNFTTSR
jgi:allophanate hydrolase